MGIDLSTYAFSEKRFPARPHWRKRDENNLELVSPLDIDGVTVEGLVFRTTALIKWPDANVMFQLEFFPPRRQPKGGPIARLEWRPFGRHNNKQIGPVELRNVLQEGSHYHDYSTNIEFCREAVYEGKLPVAVPIWPEPSFNEVLALVGKEFRISPIDWIPEPPWQPELL